MNTMQVVDVAGQRHQAGPHNAERRGQAGARGVQAARRFAAGGAELHDRRQQGQLARLGVPGRLLDAGGAGAARHRLCAVRAATVDHQSNLAQRDLRLYGHPDPLWSWRGAMEVGEHNTGRYMVPLTVGVDVPTNAVLLDAVAANDVAAARRTSGRSHFRARSPSTSATAACCGTGAIPTPSSARGGSPASWSSRGPTSPATTRTTPSTSSGSMAASTSVKGRPGRRSTAA